jgi:hypothetical protein
MICRPPIDEAAGLDGLNIDSREPGHLSINVHESVVITVIGLFHFVLYETQGNIFLPDSICKEFTSRLVNLLLNCELMHSGEGDDRAGIIAI